MLDKQIEGMNANKKAIDAMREQQKDLKTRTQKALQEELRQTAEQDE